MYVLSIIPTSRTPINLSYKTLDTTTCGGDGGHRGGGRGRGRGGGGVVVVAA